MPSVKCPCLNCGFYVLVKEGYFHYTEQQAFDKLKEHIFKHHTVWEIQEWLGRALWQYFEAELKNEA